MKVRLFSATPFLLAATFLIALPAPALAGEAPPEAPPATADTARKAAEILERMEIRTPATVWNLLPALEDLGEPALEAIQKGLQSANPAVRLACAKALYHLDNGDPAPLEALLLEGQDPVASMAASVLGAYGEDREAEILAKALEAGLAAPVRVACARALAEIRRDDPRAIQALTDLLHAQDPRTAGQAALALGEIGESGLCQKALEALRGEPTVQGRLARSLLNRIQMEKAVAEQSLPGSGTVAEVSALVRRSFADTTVVEDGKAKALDEAFLRDAAAAGIVRSLDPFCDYMTDEQFREDRRRAAGQYAGIGAYVVMREFQEPGAPPLAPWEEARLVITVDRPNYDPPAPAYRAGVRSGDQIVAYFDEGTRSWIQLVGWPMERCVERLKGPEGTVVRIRVKRHGVPGLREIAIQRQMIVVNAAAGEMLPGRIGYIALRRFDIKSASDFETALSALEAQGSRGLVLDLRGNPGGTMNQVVSIIEKFLEPNRLITYTEGRSEEWSNRYLSEQKPHPYAPLAVLIRGDSASGSEMTAGTLKAYQRGVIVGERSFGKGSGQNIFPLQSTNRTRWVRMTIFKYYLPGPGRVSIHEKGVEPDVVQEPERIESWQYDWQLHLLRAGTIEDYAIAQYPARKALFDTLARFDGLEPGRWPGFEELFRESVRVLYEGRKRWTRAAAFPTFEEFLAQHSTPQDRDFIRSVVRTTVRRLAQDATGVAFNQDFQEDIQLQRALFEVLRKLNLSPRDVPEYAGFADKFK